MKCCRLTIVYLLFLQCIYAFVFEQKAIAVSEAEFADREEKRWAKAAEREEARLYTEAQTRDAEADKSKHASDRFKSLEADAKMITKVSNHYLSGFLSNVCLLCIP